jgi:3-methyladenine DNA glycosylase AlkD
MNPIVAEVIQMLKDRADPSKVAFYNISHPTSKPLLGVDAKNKKLILKYLKEQTKTLSTEELLSNAKELVRTNQFDCQQIAYMLIGETKSLQQILTEQDIDDLIINPDNWALIDCLGVYVVGPAWRNEQISTNKIKTFSASDNYWLRRLALVATVPLNLKAQGGLGDAKRTIEICTLAIDDHHDMVVKAMSWALRELSKRDKKVVHDFIRKNNNRLHNKILREVMHKLETGKKN